MLAMVPSVTAAAATGFTTFLPPLFGMGAETTWPCSPGRVRGAGRNLVGNAQSDRLGPVGAEGERQDMVAPPRQWS